MQGAVPVGRGVGAFSGGGSTNGSASTVSKDDNLVLSSEDSSCPDESGLELGLGLTLSSRPAAKSHPTPTTPYARLLTAKDFPSVVSSSASSSASLSRANVKCGNKRAADSVVDNNVPSQVVGWPPLGAYRMNSFNSHTKSLATEVNNSMAEKSKGDITAKEKGNLRSSLLVKVNMDGIPIGRKVDLSTHSSYETLAHTLGDMFNVPTTLITCKGSNGEDQGIIFGSHGESILLDGSSKFVLTYEDKEGDWMLVGDVPWWMFLSSVRRLRIMRTSEANGLGPTLEEKNSRLKSNPI